MSAAVKAPNSSNLQTWRFWWVKDQEKKKKLKEYCFNQSAAREAMELVIVTADPNLWKVSNPEIIKYANRIKAPKLVKLYYEKLIPMTYRTGFLGIFTPFKILSLFITGIFRPITRSASLVERSAGNCHKISGPWSGELCFSIRGGRLFKLHDGRA